jgi:hypothetical protein
MSKKLKKTLEQIADDNDLSKIYSDPAYLFQNSREKDI